MASSKNNPRPSFFWQGLMIVLPVTVLAVVGLFSLRQDEQAAEQAARKKAAENVASLARAVGDMAGEEIEQFLTLQSGWMEGLCSASENPTNTFPNEKLKVDVAKWEQTYPGLKLAALALPKCDLLADGREIRPPVVPAAPSPPKWFCELTSRQRDLWPALLQDSGVVRAFLATNPSEEARQAALAAHRAPEQILYGPALPFAESGIPFQDLACYQMLEAKAPLTHPFLYEVRRRIFENPSFVAPALLALVEGQTNGADSFAVEKVHRMRQWWDKQYFASQRLEPLRKLAEIRQWSLNPGWARWSQTSTERALGLFEGTVYKGLPEDTNSALPSGQGWIISFIPSQVVEAIVARALSENRFLVPDYTVADVAIENEPLSSLSDNSKHGEKSPLPRLAFATRKIGGYSAYHNITMDIAFYLASREKMLSAEKRRTRLFGALIGGAVLAALAGLLAARRAFYEQQRLSEMKSNFVSSVSHELRAPIASMRLLSESLERGKVSDAGKKQDYYRFLVQESRRLTSLIENVLDFSRIEQGRKEYQREPADLDAIVEDTIKLMQPGAAEKQVGLARRPFIGPGPLVTCDGLAMQQALINLIDNAIKHSPPGAQVEVGLEDGAPNGIRLWVEDQGPGIPPEEHEKIFERFYRRGSELRRETQGIGIGLTIVKHIVEAHAGRVLVRSAVGQGSRFTIELPVNAGP